MYVALFNFLTCTTKVFPGLFSNTVSLYTAWEHLGLLSFKSVTLTVTDATACNCSDVKVSFATTFKKSVTIRDALIFAQLRYVS